MLYYALVFLVIAALAFIIGFGGFAGAMAGAAQLLFFLFLVLVASSIVVGLMRRV
ncbi:MULTISPECIES: DUF1328 family protein [unclassified Devosia]|uniref:DUF1328 family protein n=1 Tax=unclassified Devosia TaxID=196773 RepID=UPI001555F2C7|nr:MULTISPECIES: DUF1328 family protein [unclassified Devosia]